RRVRDFGENSHSAISIRGGSGKLWQATRTAAYRGVVHHSSVTATCPSESLRIRATPGRGAPECREASEVPADQWAGRGAGQRQSPRGTCAAPPTIRCWSVSQLVITTRKISSMELGKSESQPPVPNPTWPKTSRCRNV